MGQRLVADTQVLIRYANAERTFQPGERINFTPADLSGIWLTLHTFGLATTENVIKLAKKRGLIAEEVKLTDPSPESG